MLAGHSYGGLVVRMFADRYPDEVVGLVLVDASHPDQWVSIPASRGGRTVAMGNRVTALLARLGLLRLFRAERSFIDGLPAREYAEMRAYLARPQGWSAGAAGLLAWDRQSRDQVNAARDLGDLPLVVLSVTEQDRYAEVLTRLQADLVSLSSNSAHLTVAGATHYTLVSKQNFAEVVSDAIRAVVSAAQSGGPVTAEWPATQRRHVPPNKASDPLEESHGRDVELALPVKAMTTAWRGHGVEGDHQRFCGLEEPRSPARFAAGVRLLP